MQKRSYLFVKAKRKRKQECLTRPEKQAGYKTEKEWTASDNKKDSYFAVLYVLVGHGRTIRILRAKSSSISTYGRHLESKAASLEKRHASSKVRPNIARMDGIDISSGIRWYIVKTNTVHRIGIRTILARARTVFCGI